MMDPTAEQIINTAAILLILLAFILSAMLRHLLKKKKRIEEEKEEVELAKLYPKVYNLKSKSKVNRNEKEFHY